MGDQQKRDEFFRELGKAVVDSIIAKLSSIEDKTSMILFKIQTIADDQQAEQALAEQLKGPTESLAAAVEKNQPTTGGN